MIKRWQEGSSWRHFLSKFPSSMHNSILRFRVPNTTCCCYLIRIYTALAIIYLHVVILEIIHGGAPIKHVCMLSMLNLYYSLVAEEDRGPQSIFVTDTPNIMLCKEDICVKRMNLLSTHCGERTKAERRKPCYISKPICRCIFQIVMDLQQMLNWYSAQLVESDALILPRAWLQVDDDLTEDLSR